MSSAQNECVPDRSHGVRARPPSASTWRACFGRRFATATPKSNRVPASTSRTSSRVKARTVFASANARSSKTSRAKLRSCSPRAVAQSCCRRIARRCTNAGFVAYLETSLEQQAERVRQGRNRPLLHDVDPLTKLTELMVVRAPLYEVAGRFHHRHRRTQGARGRRRDLRGIQGGAGNGLRPHIICACGDWRTCSEST